MRERLLAGLGLLLTAVLAAGLSSRLAPPLPVAYAAIELPGTPTDQLAVAADALAAALASGGTGLTFEVVQRDSVHAKPGGPLIGVRDPADPTKVVAEVEQVAVNAVITRGAITAEAFWMEMRLSPGSEPDPRFDGSAFFSRVLERGGVIWRDDGDGWYETDVSPGSGMDPVSARLLPKLLLSAADVTGLQPELKGGRLLPGVSGASPVSATTRASSRPTAGTSPRRPSRWPTGSMRPAGSSALRPRPSTSTRTTTNWSPRPS